MRKCLLIVLAIAAPAAALAQSPEKCPWLNSGTAAKALGAEVTAASRADSNWSGSCRFSTQTNPPRAIEISVGKADSHPCGSSGTSVKSLGNEATLCSVRGADGHESQVLTGRVRDAWFVVTMTMPHAASGNSPPGSEDSDSSVIRFLAEQVAGNLY